MGYSFIYNGPKSKVEDRDCTLCATVARQQCLIAGEDGLVHSSPVVGCSHCDAVASGICPSHCGIDLAVSHAKDVPSEVKSFVAAHCSSLPESQLNVHVLQHTPGADEVEHLFLVSVRAR